MSLESMCAVRTATSKESPKGVVSATISSNAKVTVEITPCQPSIGIPALGDNDSVVGTRAEVGRKREGCLDVEVPKEVDRENGPEERKTPGDDVVVLVWKKVADVVQRESVAGRPGTETAGRRRSVLYRQQAREMARR